MSSHQSQKAAWEEGVALGLLRELDDPDPPADAVALAELCELRVEYVRGPRAWLAGDVIHVPAHTDELALQADVIHELGHWALGRAKVPDSEVSATYVGDALMLERRRFDALLRATAWEMGSIRAKHVHCSPAMIARRIVAMRDACASVWEGRRLVARWASPWLAAPLQRVSRFERDLARSALEHGGTVREGELLWAFLDGPRVITVCEAEQLTFRF